MASEPLDQAALWAAWRDVFFGLDGRLHRSGELLVRDLVKLSRFDERLDGRTRDGGLDMLSLAHAEGRRSLFLDMLRRAGGDVTILAKVDDERPADATEFDPLD